jgi:VRR-NUC domain
MTERELQDAIIQAARLLGWRVMHQRPGRTLDGWRTAVQGDEGFPDLVMLRPPRLIFAELKSKKGVLSQAQALWLNGFRASGPAIETYEWRPQDWEHGDIEDVLR